MTQPTAQDLLTAAGAHMAQRATTYDAEGGERSMGKAVAALNAITGQDVTEAQGWLLMELLKNVRLFARPAFHQDSAEDGVAYAALMGEAKAREVAPRQMLDLPVIQPEMKADKADEWRGERVEDPHAELRKIYKPGMRWKCKRRFDVLWTDWEQLKEPGFRAGMEYEIHPDDLPKQDKDGYTIWHGGEQPEETKGKVVSARLRNAGYLTRAAKNLDWQHTPKELQQADIVAYKVIE